LWTTFVAHLAHLALDENLFNDVAIDADSWVDDMIGAVVAEIPRGQRPSPQRIAKLRSVISLGKDFVSSVSTSQRSFETFLAGTRQIVTGTCVGLGRTSLGLTSTPFDLVIVDEAARCTASELAVPIQAGRWLVLVGDHAQLQPQHDNEVVKRVSAETGIPLSDILKSDFERLFQSSYGRGGGATLKLQYRMLPAIGKLVSNTFYEGGLEPGRTDPVIPKEALPNDLQHPITWFTTDGLGARAFETKVSDGNSRWNQTEVEAIAALLKRCNDNKKFMAWAAKQTYFSQVIGVICMYAEQRNLLRKKMQTLSLSDEFRRLLKIDTVDSYQGKQNPIVIVSLVRNNADGGIEDGLSTISQGFLSRPNRINVAASRSMDRLVIVGAYQRWRRKSPMANLAQAVAKAAQEEEAVLRSVGEIMGPETAPIEKTKKHAEAAS
jgi:AAA domain